MPYSTNDALSNDTKVNDLEAKNSFLDFVAARGIHVVFLKHTSIFFILQVNLLKSHWLFGRVYGFIYMAAIWRT